MKLQFSRQIFEKYWNIKLFYADGRRDMTKLIVAFHNVTNARKKVQLNLYTWIRRGTYRGADKSLPRPTSRYILFDGENISFDASFVIYIYIYIVLIFLQLWFLIGYMNIKIFCRCGLFPSWSGYGLISTHVRMFCASDFFF
jgi:hypothetical protein